MLVLYHASHSTCSQKVRLVLHEKGLDFQDIKLDLGKKDQLKPEYIAINPNGVVPSLVDDGIPIIESSVICEYLDEKFPEPSHLTPMDLVERAQMRAWMHYIEEVAVPAIRVPSFNRAFLYRFDGLDQRRFEDEQMNVRKVRKELFQNMGSPKGFTRQAVDKALGELQETCRRMHDSIDRTGGPWLMGKQFTLADVLVMPSIDRMADLKLSHLWETFPNVASWYEKLQARPAFRKTYYPGSRVSDFLELRPLYADER